MSKNYLTAGGFSPTAVGDKGAAGFRPSLCEDKLRILPRAKAALVTGRFDYSEVLARPYAGAIHLHKSI